MKKSFLFIALVFLGITLLFFHPTLKGFVPFPGDLLISSNPYSSESYLGYSPGGVPNKAQGPDVIKESYPWKFFVVNSLRSGNIPFWNPHNFSGNPLMANFQSAVFYPLNLIFLVFQFNLAWSVFIMLGPLLAGIFNYLFLREIKLSKVASIYGGIVFAFSSYMTVWLEYGNITHTVLWLPLGLYLTEKIIKKIDAKFYFYLIFVLFLSFLAGYIQGYFYICSLLTFYFIAKSWSLKKINYKKLLIFISVIIIPAFLSLFQLLPTIELFKLSTRGNYSLSEIQVLLNPIWYMITIIVPDFFGHPATRNFWFNGTYIERVSYFGVIPFIFALTSILNFEKNLEIKIFSAAFLLVFLLTSDVFITKYFYLIPIPVISTTVPTRALILLVYCGSVLAAFGMEYFLQKKEKFKFLISIIMVGIVILLSWVFVFSTTKLHNAEWAESLSIAKRNLLLPTAFLLSFIVLSWIWFGKKKIFKKISVGILVVVIFVITVFDLFYFFHKITPFSQQEFIYPKTSVAEFLHKNAGVYRYWGYGSGYIDSNFQMVDNIYTPDGGDPLHLKNYTRLLSSSSNGEAPEVLPRPYAKLAPGFGPKDLNDNFYRQKLLNILGVKYILHREDLLGNEFSADSTTFPIDKYKLIWQEGSWQIYENKNVIPRIFLTDRYEVIKDSKKLLTRIYDKDFDESKTILLHEDPKLQKNLLKNSSVKVVKYQPNLVEIKTTTDSDSLLFISDNYFPSWKVKVDGSNKKIFVANYAFRAVKVPKGKHEVIFYFESDAFNKGAIISGILLIAIVIVYYFISIPKDKVNKGAKNG